MIEKVISKISPKYYWVVSFVLGALSMFVMLSYAQLLSTGKYVILNGDALEQYISHIRMISRNIINGESPFFSYSLSMGLSTIIPFAWHVICPFNILFLIFYKADPNVIAAIVIILKGGMASLSFQLFARVALKKNGLASIVFSIMYSLCAFSVAYGILHFIWLDGVYMLPLVALGVVLAARDNRYMLLTMAYSYIFTIQFYMGYMIGIFSFIIFLCLLFVSFNKLQKRELFFRIIKYIYSILCAVLISSVVWIPFLMFLLKYRAADSTPLSFYSIRISLLEIINNMFWGQYQGNTYAPYIYCGLPSMILLPLFFSNKEIPSKRRILMAIMLGVVILFCIFKPLNYMMHAFDVPDGFEFRFSFMVSFLLCIVGVIQADYLNKINWKQLLLIIVSVVLLYLLEIHLGNLRVSETLETGEKVLNNSFLRLLINVGVISVWGLIVFLYSRMKKNRLFFSLLIIMCAMAEMITNGVVCLNAFHNFKESVFYAWSDDLQGALSDINKTEHDNSYRIIVYNDIMHNSDSYFGYYGVTDFATGENEKLRDFMKNMGFYTSPRSTRGTGMTPSMEMLLSVKYSVRLFSHLVEAGIDADPQVNENKVLPIGFMVDDTAADVIDMSSNVFVNQNSVFSYLSGIDDLYTEVSEDNRYEQTSNIRLIKNADGISIIPEGSEGQVVYRVKETEGKVFIQFDPVEETEGYLVSSDTRNIACLRGDNNATISCAYYMWGADKDHFLITYADEGLSDVISLNAINEYVLNDSKLEEIYQSLSKECLEIEECKAGYIKGNISINSDRRLLFTSIPYVDGWSVFVNDQKVEPTLLLNKNFMGVSFPQKGNYKVEFKYNPPGIRIGIIISALGFVLLLLAIILEKKEKHYA